MSQTGKVHDGAEADVEVKLLAQGHVEGADAATDRGSQGALEKKAKGEEGTSEGRPHSDITGAPLFIQTTIFFFFLNELARTLMPTRYLR